MKLFNVAIRQENNTFHAQTPDIPEIHITGPQICWTNMGGYQPKFSAF